MGQIVAISILIAILLGFVACALGHLLRREKNDRPLEPEIQAGEYVPNQKAFEEWQKELEQRLRQDTKDFLRRRS